MKTTQMMTAEIEAMFNKIGRQEDVEDPIVVAKYFNPYGRSTWYATEYDTQTECFFGYCVGELGTDCDEWGYFSLDGLEQVRVRRLGFKLPLERDRHFSPQKMSKACPNAFAKLGREVPDADNSVTALIEEIAGLIETVS